MQTQPRSRGGRDSASGRRHGEGIDGVSDNETVVPDTAGNPNRFERPLAADCRERSRDKRRRESESGEAEPSAACSIAGELVNILIYLPDPVYVNIFA